MVNYGHSIFKVRPSSCTTSGCSPSDLSRSGHARRRCWSIITVARTSRSDGAVVTNQRNITILGVLTPTFPTDYQVKRYLEILWSFMFSRLQHGIWPALTPADVSIVILLISDYTPAPLLSTGSNPEPEPSSSRRSSTETSRNTIKRKLSLQNMMNSLKISDKSATSAPNPGITPEEEEEVFSEGELSDEESGSFRTKHSLDSSGNSPRYFT